MELLDIAVLNQLPPEIREIVLRVLLFLFAVIVIWALRHLLTWILIRPMRILAKRTKMEFDDLLIEVLIGPMRYLVIALGITITVNVMDFGPAITSFAELLTRTFFIVAAFYAIYKIFTIISITPVSLVRFTGFTIEERLLPFLRTIIRIMIVVIALLIILREWGFDISGLVASVGIIGLAISLAAQDTVANFFGFTTIVGDRPFNVGDFIKTGDTSGIVEHVGMRSTRLRQLDQALVTVPNNKLANAAVLNWTQLKKRRMSATLQLTYSTTSAQMRVLLTHLRDLLNARPLVEASSVRVFFIGFGDHALEVLVIADIFLPDWAAFTAEKELINLEIMELVEKLGLQFAFPTQTLHIESWPKARSAAPVEMDAEMYQALSTAPDHQPGGPGEDQISDDPHQR